MYSCAYPWACICDGDSLSVFWKADSTELEKEAFYAAQGVESSGMEYLEKLDGKNSRITLIDQDGSVLYDSQAEASSMENHKDREEVKEAAETGKGKAVRMSETLSEKQFTTL